MSKERLTREYFSRAEAEAKVKVYYDGDPKFQPIEGTSLQYAGNTAEKIIKVGDLYYLCLQGIWFVSTNPQGPWQTAQSVPQCSCQRGGASMRQPRRPRSVLESFPYWCQPP